MWHWTCGRVEGCERRRTSEGDGGERGVMYSKARAVRTLIGSGWATALVSYSHLTLTVSLATIFSAYFLPSHVLYSFPSAMTRRLAYTQSHVQDCQFDPEA